MKKLQKKMIQQVSGYICDRCGREAEVGDMEAEEFISIERVGGCRSIFGDGNRISADICQHCLKEVLGKWLNIAPYTL